MRKIICVILALFLASSAAFAGYQIFREYTERQESADTYTDLENLISFPEVIPEEEPDETNLSESGETEPAPVGPTIDFAGLEEINEDCVAWIYIEDTAINYPVVQGSDNSYYLKHLIDGKWNSAGCIFLDSRVDSDISDRHSIIYGHHMKDGSMFRSIRGYTKEDGYYDKHKTLELATPHGNYHLVVFSAFITKATDEDTYKMTYGEAEKQAYIDRAWERSELPITRDSVDVTKNDRLVTLSTCAYDYEEARYIVMCKMVPWTKAEVQAGKDAQKQIDAQKK